MVTALERTRNLSIANAVTFQVVRFMTWLSDNYLRA